MYTYNINNRTLKQSNEKKKKYSYFRKKFKI